MTKDKVVDGLQLSEPTSVVFDRWAHVYDTDLNPLLMLEERTLPQLLPSICGAHVLDVGCGTGRWLHRLEALQPASLTGIDCSGAMIEQALKKCATRIRLVQEDLFSFAGSDESQDLILSSFVLSYLDNLPAFALECNRIVRSGGYVLLTDVHPTTARERGWSRGFHVDGESVRLATSSRSLSDIIAAFDAAGFDCCTVVEPSFELPERAVFERAGKLAEFDQLTGVPAIYLLKMQKRIAANLRLANAAWGVSATQWSDTELQIEDGRIVCPKSDERLQISLDLSGYVLVPGLINAHDHLEFALFPNLGRSPELPCYANSAEWAKEIHELHAQAIEQHRRVPLETRVWWGAIRNLLCGVTTVCHHNPMHAALTRPDFPVRVVTKFGWSHSLAFDENMQERFQATPAGQPFIVHAAEGCDQQSREELLRLDVMGLLDGRTVIVHGLALAAEDVALLNRRGASLVVCPTSNTFLFGRSPSKGLLESAKRLALGSDSPLTAAGDLLDEVRYLHAEQGLDAEMLYELVTTNAAEILHLPDGAGRIQDSCPADLIAVRNSSRNPAEMLADLSFVDVELVLIGGSIQLASEEIYSRLSHDLRRGLHLLEVDGRKRWLRADAAELLRSAEEALGKDFVRLGGKEVRHVAAL